jgi:hypothetical protein
VAPSHRPGRGKSARFARFVEAYAEEIEADLVYFCNGLDLRDVWRPGGGASRLTWRRLENLVSRLPPESATKTALRDEMSPEELAMELAAAREEQPGHGPWSRLELRVMALYDQLSWVIYAIYHAQGGKPDRPEPYPRPGVQPVSQPITPEGVAYLERLRQSNNARKTGG